MKKVKLTDFPNNIENPFMNCAPTEIAKHTRYQIKSRDMNEEIWVNETTGEAATLMLGKRVVKDDDQFVKLFPSMIGQLFELSNSGIRVLCYIMTCMKPKNDMIIFMLKDCMEFTNYTSKAPIYKGLAELLAAQIIARGETDYLYYINPLIMFNGDRIGFCTIYEKKSRALQAKQLSLPFSTDK